VAATSLNDLLKGVSSRPQTPRIAMRKHTIRPGNIANWLNLQLLNVKNMKSQTKFVLLLLLKNKIKIKYSHYKTYN
jgi:hypothetical protein